MRPWSLPLRSRMSHSGSTTPLDKKPHASMPPSRSLCSGKGTKPLLTQDQFICDNITKDDILIVSVGCNDVAMKPTSATIFHMLVLAWLTRLKSIENGSAWALRYFARLFRDKTEAYLRRLCSKVTPRAIVLCMIYFPLEAKGQQKLGRYSSQVPRLQQQSW